MIARSAPSCSQALHFSSLPAVTKTLKPSALAIWMAVVPMPLEPPWISSVSSLPRGPLPSRPRSNTLLQTVKKVSGSAAASISDKPAGTGRHCATGAVHSSA
ncbi:hypothetical protein D3C81_1704970 [compost metagenome]